MSLLRQGQTIAYGTKALNMLSSIWEQENTMPDSQDNKSSMINNPQDLKPGDTIKLVSVPEGVRESFESGATHAQETHNPQLARQI